MVREVIVLPWDCVVLGVPKSVQWLRGSVLGSGDLAPISVRHEALLVRMEVRDRPSPRCRSGGVKLRAA
jgi:hypothetical protein